jgi:hypothetical protein
MPKIPYQQPEDQFNQWLNLPITKAADQCDPGSGLILPHLR